MYDVFILKFSHGVVTFVISEGIAKQLKSTLLPGSTELKNIAESDAFFNSEENCVIGQLEFVFQLSRLTLRSLCPAIK